MKEQPPPIQDRATVLHVTNIEAIIALDSDDEDPAAFPLSQWRGKEMPKPQDRVYRAAGYDTKTDQKTEKWRILPPELDVP